MLEGSRIVECGCSAAAAYGGRLLPALGADVAKVEPPEGAPLRHGGDCLSGQASPETAGLHLYLGAGKRSVVLDQTRPQSNLRASASAMSSCAGIDLQIVSMVSALLEPAIEVLLGVFPAQGEKARVSPDMQQTIERSGRSLGQDNDHVFGHLHGPSAQRIGELEDADVIT
jgi:crotonobetainyl-CoA:carnitine CoA-transferase CaiB-like acyl-CoA transferase